MLSDGKVKTGRNCNFNTCEHFRVVSFNFIVVDLYSGGSLLRLDRVVSFYSGILCGLEEYTAVIYA
jgi:hypothetical protein